MKLFGLVITTERKLESEYNANKIIAVRYLKKRLTEQEELNWKQFKKIDKLEKENLWLKNHQKIEIVDLERGKEW